VDVNDISSSENKSIGPEHVGHEAMKGLGFFDIFHQLGFAQNQSDLATLLIVGHLVHPSSERELSRYAREQSALEELIGANFSYIVVSRSNPEGISDESFADIKEGVKAKIIKQGDELFLHCVSEGKLKKEKAIVAKRHKIHKNNNLHIGISNSYGRQKYKFGLFTRPSILKQDRLLSPLPPVAANEAFKPVHGLNEPVFFYSAGQSYTAFSRGTKGSAWHYHYLFLGQQIQGESLAV